MNWYSIFYWITVADGVKDFFDAFSNIFTFFTVLTLIVTIVASVMQSDSTNDEDDTKSAKHWAGFFRKIFVWMTIMMVITWAGYVFCPTKKDALIIVAGGSVGTFITSDSSARQVPSEVMTLLRDKIRSEIRDIHVADDIKERFVDSLKSKTKEELIEMLKSK